MKGGGKGRPRGRGNAQGASKEWDFAQRNAKAPMNVSDLGCRRPQKIVEAFNHLTVAADWPERHPPRSGSAFYLPLIWTALVLEDDGSLAQVDGQKSSAVQQLESLGDAKHFGSARRASVGDLQAAQAYWSAVFSGWADWVCRLRAAMDDFVSPAGVRGREGVVAAFVHRLSVSACAMVYGDLFVLGAVPHISNARQAPHQDAILELDFCLRIELEAAIATLYSEGGTQTAADGTPACAEESAQASGLLEVRGAGGSNEAEKEQRKIRKKLKEIEDLKQRPRDELDVLQLRKLECEAELLHRIAVLSERQ